MLEASAKTRELERKNRLEYIGECDAYQVKPFCSIIFSSSPSPVP